MQSILIAMAALTPLAGKSLFIQMLVFSGTSQRLPSFDAFHTFVLLFSCWSHCLALLQTGFANYKDIVLIQGNF